MRESQKAESQSCRLLKARTPRESKQNRSSRIRSIRWSVLAADYPLPDLLFSLPLSLSPPIHISLFLRTTSLSQALECVYPALLKAWWTKRRRTRTRFAACRKSIFHVIIRTVRKRNSPRPLLRCRRHSLEVGRARRILIVV